MRSRSRAGVTLMELLIAVTLFSLLSVAMLYAFRIGLTAYAKTQSKLMDNRRVAGAQRILLQELQNMIPVVSTCPQGEGGTLKGPFFQGSQESMRLVSTFSLEGASRGIPQLLEIFVSPMDTGEGVRLLVNETPYTGPAGGAVCTPPSLGATAGKSFVLADNLAFCRFSYLRVPLDVTPERVWVQLFPKGNTWPRAVRIEMAPKDPDPSRLQPISVTALIRLHRNSEVDYGDF